VGVGGIGTFLTYVAARSGGEVIAVDVDPRRLEVAGSLGASRALDPGRQDPREVVSDLDALPVIYEATGVPAGFASAWEMVPAGARLVAVGIQKEPLAVDLPVLTVGEREVIGTNAHAVAVDLPAAARLVAAREEGWSDIAPVVLPLESLVDDALIPMVEGRSSRIKSLFDPGADNSRPFRV
ncbi:MAG: zinc-binding dehydrogenase, partial [Actinomycetota bacterium]